MKEYPTKEEILAKDPKIDKDIINIVKEWKEMIKKYWKDYNNKSKEEAIVSLITLICIKAKEYTPEIHFDSKSSSYEPEIMAIWLEKDNPSIISALHELAHHLYGPSELTACRWSVWLFKECFPEWYSKLKWKRHLLTK